MIVRLVVRSGAYGQGVLAERATRWLEMYSREWWRVNSTDWEVGSVSRVTVFFRMQVSVFSIFATLHSLLAARPSGKETVERDETKDELKIVPNHHNCCSGPV